MKTISKPISNRIKKEAGRHPRFREIIISIAQKNNCVATNMQRRLCGLPIDKKIQPLDEEKAVQAATDIFGEILMFMVAGSIVVFEVQRSSRAEKRREEAFKQELMAIKEKGLELEGEVGVYERRIAELQKFAGDHKGLLSILHLKHDAGAPQPSKLLQRS